MEAEIWKYFITQGPFAALFVWLLLSTRKDSKDREARLQDLLEKFSSKYDVIIAEIRDMKERFLNK